MYLSMNWHTADILEDVHMDEELLTAGVMLNEDKVE